MTATVRIAAISLGVTFCLLALKLVLGILSDSIAVLSDAVDSGTDLVGGTAALLSVRIAARPADEEHPYGHGKIESLSASVAATVVAIGGGFIVFQAARRLIEGSPEIDVGLGLAPMVIAAVANLVLAFYMRREARRSHSLALASESTHLQTNVVQALAIIAGLTLVGVTGERLFDPLVALGLAAYMAWTAVGLARHALAGIMDVALPDDELRVIQEAITARGDDIRGFHRLRTRRSGPVRHVDVHLAVDPQRTIEDLHEVCDEIEAEIRSKLPNAEVVIHLEPDVAESRGPLETIIRGGA